MASGPLVQEEMFDDERMLPNDWNPGLFHATLSSVQGISKSGGNKGQHSRSQDFSSDGIGQ
jgi:hypothetical protein